MFPITREESITTMTLTSDYDWLSSNAQVLSECDEGLGIHDHGWTEHR